MLKKWNAKALSAGLDRVVSEGKKHSQNVSDSAVNQVVKFREAREAVSDENWYRKAAEATESLVDAIGQNEHGFSRKAIRALAGKLGAVSSSAGIFAIASVLGTASTGTAIGTLSGAAFSSAALAWVGGSVLAGSAIVGLAALSGGVGIAVATNFVLKRYLYGKAREGDGFTPLERAIVDTALSLAYAFREQEKSGEKIDPLVAKALYDDALKPLCDKLLEYKYSIDSWPVLARKRVEKAIAQIERATVYLGNWAKAHPTASIGTVSAVFLQLLADDVPDLQGNELLVLEAIRRSTNELSDASLEDVGEYLRAKTPEQLSGELNNVKGIYHELLFQHQENTDGDDWVVELFPDTNHAGSDVVLINVITGERKEIQLKATNYLSYIEEHNERYSDIAVFATSEVASKSDAIQSTGFSNETITDETQSTLNELAAAGESLVGESMLIAGMITLAKNTKALLGAGDGGSKEGKVKVLRESASAAGVAGLVSLLIS